MKIIGQYIRFPGRDSQLSNTSLERYARSSTRLSYKINAFYTRADVPYSTHPERNSHETVAYLLGRKILRTKVTVKNETKIYTNYTVSPQFLRFYVQLNKCARTHQNWKDPLTLPNL
jgi:hypothetical protein